LELMVHKQGLYLLLVLIAEVPTLWHIIQGALEIVHT
jgi:hypothetical protein